VESICRTLSGARPVLRRALLSSAIGTPHPNFRFVKAVSEVHLNRSILAFSTLLSLMVRPAVAADFYQIEVDRPVDSFQADGPYPGHFDLWSPPASFWQLLANEHVAKSQCQWPGVDLAGSPLMLVFAAPNAWDQSGARGNGEMGHPEAGGRADKAPPRRGGRGSREAGTVSGSVDTAATPPRSVFLMVHFPTVLSRARDQNHDQIRLECVTDITSKSTGSLLARYTAVVKVRLNDAAAASAAQAPTASPAAPPAD